MKLWVNKTQYGYSTRIKNDYDNKSIQMYMDVQFKRDEDPEISCLIKVENAFFSCYECRDGSIKPKLVVTEYEIVENSYSNKDELVDVEDIDNSENEDVQLDLDFLNNEQLD